MSVQVRPVAPDKAELAYWLCPSLPSWSKEFDSPTLLHFALVVQRIEQQPSKLWVAGSIPAERAN
jgi:hypothetical protein